MRLSVTTISPETPTYVAPFRALHLAHRFLNAFFRQTVMALLLPSPEAVEEADTMHNYLPSRESRVSRRDRQKVQLVDASLCFVRRISGARGHFAISL